jgi:predicted DNA-binding transcriptional regulator AlpA
VTSTSSYPGAREWQVHVDVRLAREIPGGARSDAAADVSVALVEALAEHAAAGGAGGDRASATLTVTASEPVTAAARARQLVTAALAGLGYPVADVLALEVTAYEVVDERHARASIPDLVTAVDVAEMLGVSRQRVHQLAAREDFPDPLLHLGGPIWVRPAVEAFAARWDRRGGRPRSAPQADVA